MRQRVPVMSRKARDVRNKPLPFRGRVRLFERGSRLVLLSRDETEEEYFERFEAQMLKLENGIKRREVGRFVTGKPVIPLTWNVVDAGCDKLGLGTFCDRAKKIDHHAYWMFDEISARNQLSGFPKLEMDALIAFRSTPVTFGIVPQRTRSSRYIDPDEWMEESFERRWPSKQEISSFYKSEEWVTLRFDTLVRLGNRCCLCGRAPQDDKSISCHVDHIEPVHVAWHRRFDPKNLQILCRICNWGKGGRHFEVEGYN